MEYMTVAQAAAELGLTVRGVRDRIDRGEMEAVKMNPRLYLVPIAEVERWKVAGRQKPGPKLGSRRKTPDQPSGDGGQPMEETRR